MKTLDFVAFEVRHDPYAPWPGCLFGRTVATPDPARFLVEAELIAVKGRGPLLVRLEGPLSRPETMPPAVAVQETETPGDPAA